MSEVRVSDSVETGSGSPGAVLRRCREFHEVTLEEASEATKIGVSYLMSLESDQIHDFANQAYLKGFLRVYTTYLGLNFDDIALLYDKLFGVQGGKPDLIHVPTPSPRHPRSFTSFKKMLFPLLLLVVILITATFFKQPSTPPVRQPQPKEIIAPPRENMAIQKIESSVTIRKVEKIIPPPKAEVAPAEPLETEKTVTLQRQVTDMPKGFILKIRVTQNGTLTSTVDGAEPQKYELAIGDVIEWKAEKNVTLDLSNAGGVDVELNGKPYKPLGAIGKPAYVELDAAGIKE